MLTYIHDTYIWPLACKWPYPLDWQLGTHFTIILNLSIWFLFFKKGKNLMFKQKNVKVLNDFSMVIWKGMVCKINEWEVLCNQFWSCWDELYVRYVNCMVPIFCNILFCKSGSFPWSWVFPLYYVGFKFLCMSVCFCVWHLFMW